MSNTQPRREKTRRKESKSGAVPEPDAPSSRQKKTDRHEGQITPTGSFEGWRKVFGVDGPVLVPEPNGRPRCDEIYERGHVMSEALAKAEVPSCLVGDVLDVQLFEEAIFRTLTSCSGALIVPDNLRERSIADYSPSYLYARSEGLVCIEEAYTDPIDGNKSEVIVGGEANIMVALGHFALDDSNPDDYENYDPYEHLEFHALEYLAIYYTHVNGFTVYDFLTPSLNLVDESDYWDDDDVEDDLWNEDDDTWHDDVRAMEASLDREVISGLCEYCSRHRLIKFG